MKYAVIAISGTQYQVAENDTITVDRIDGQEGDKLSTDQVLLVVNDKDVNVGQPLVDKAKVDTRSSITKQKLRVFKYKANPLSRTLGFRLNYDIQNLKITLIPMEYNTRKNNSKKCQMPPSWC